jgi:yeast amino acid transporter
LTLGVAGPEGTLLAFILLGLVAMAVMEGICEMIVLWPIPNAMVEFVRAFVDPDLAIVVGLSYWFVKLP